jgi:hypothetical protein
MDLLERVVKKSSELFKLPTQGLFVDDSYLVIVSIAQASYYNKNEGKFNFSYDFNKEIWDKVGDLRMEFGGTAGCDGIQTYHQFHQSLNPELPYMLTDSTLSEISEDKYENENEGESDIPAYWKNPEELFDVDFQPVVRKIRKTYRKFSEPCIHRYWCRKFIQCKYSHSEQEREYFKEHSQMEPFKRGKYKTRYCTNMYCLYKGKTYLCPFAHDLKEAKCVRCAEIGIHWSDDCPLKQD